MNLPDFPNSRELTLEDKPALDALFAADPPELSTYTFTNLFAWREPHHLSITHLNGCVILFCCAENNRVCLEPLGATDKRAIIEAVIEEHPTDIEFIRISPATAALFKDDPNFTVTSDRNNYDYLYRASDLIWLPGRKYDAKRNHIGKFRKNHYEYVRMDRALADECQDFADYWCEERDCDSVEGLRRERQAVREMLDNFDALGIIGGAIKIEGRVVAFELGEALNPETMVIHVEKADSRVEGLYQVINNEFCIHEAAGFEYVNREQDMGIAGLRKAKLSYHPVRMVETYRIRRA